MVVEYHVVRSEKKLCMYGNIDVIKRVFRKRTWTNRLVLGSLSSQLIGCTHGFGRFEILIKPIN